MKNKSSFESNSDKGNLTIKDQIANLQNTIKKLKSEMYTSMPKSPINDNINKPINNNSIQIKENNKFDDDKNGKNYDVNQETFSKIQKNNTEEKEEKYETTIKKNFYQENMSRLLKEKKMLNQMNEMKQSLKSSTNSKSLNNINNLKNLNFESPSDDGSEEEIEKILFQNKKGTQNNQNIRSNQNIRNNQFNQQNNNNYSTDYCQKNNPYKKFKGDSSLQLEDLSNDYTSNNPNNNVYMNNNFNDQYNYQINQSKEIPYHILNRNKSAEPIINNRGKSHKKIKNNNKPCLTPNRIRDTSRNKSPDFYKKKVNITTNNYYPPSAANCKRCKEYGNEIAKLKNENLKLRNEIAKLNKKLTAEAKKNINYKNLIEEIIKQYEKTKKK